MTPYCLPSHPMAAGTHTASPRPAASPPPGQPRSPTSMWARDTQNLTMPEQEAIHPTRGTN